MKRLLALALMLISALCCLFGCVGQPKYEREVFYGVVKYSEDFERLLIYIPNLGDVDIPDCDNCSASFGENKNTAYTLEAGDLVVISFEYEKSWDEHGVSIMELYPARFDRKPNSIEAIAKNIEFEKIDGGYVLSFDSESDSKRFKTEDDVCFVNNNVQNASNNANVVARGMVKTTLGNRITIVLEDIESPSEFLKSFTSLKLEATE